jgi:hypothetical protein
MMQLTWVDPAQSIESRERPVRLRNLLLDPS